MNRLKTILLLWIGSILWPGDLVAIETNGPAQSRVVQPSIPTKASGGEDELKPAPGKPEQLAVLTKAQEVRLLSPERALWQYPVRLRGVVTVILPGNLNFFIQDETSGIYIQPAKIQSGLKPGDLVEVQGVSNPGGYAPIVTATNITVVGNSPFPDATPMTLFQLATGQEGSQWIEVNGVVRNLSYTNGTAQLELNDPSGTLLVLVPANHAPTNLLDAVVRIRGACASMSNTRRQLIQPVLYVSSLDFVSVEEPGIADPLSLPTQPIVRLSQFRPHAAIQRLVNVTGVVTACLPGQSFFVQDETDGVQVFLSKAATVKPGDRVVVAGYPTYEKFGSSLRDSIVRVLAHGAMPDPKLLLTRNAVDVQFHGRWMELKARLLSRSRVDNTEVLTLDYNNRVIEAHRILADEPSPLTLGSILQLTGVYQVVADESRSPISFQLLMPVGAKIKVLETPPWWNGSHVLLLLGVLAVTTLGTILWLLTLRKRVRKQTALIRVQLERESAIEKNYRELFDGAHDLIYTHDLSGRFTSINPAGLKILGFTLEELKQLTIDDLVAPEYRERVRRLRQPTEYATGPRVCELELIARSGNRVIVEASKKLTFKDGSPDGISVIARDITERKQIETALAQTSGLLEVLLDNSPDFIYFKDARSRFTRCSRSLAGFFNCDPESIKGKTDFDFFTEEHARSAFDDEQEIIRTGTPIIGKLEKEIRFDGRVSWALTTKLPWRDKNGETIGTFGISKNITAIKEAEEKLAYEQELLQTLIDNLPDCIYFKDLQSRFVRVSRSMAQLFHVPDAESLTGKTDFDFFAEEHARPAYEDEQEIIRTGKPLVGKLERETHSDGRVTWALTTKMPWRDKDGKIIGTLGVSKDISELKKAEDELESTHKRLLETSRLAGMAEVATDVLHNVGNVLNSVNVASSLVIDRVKQSKLANLPKVAALIEKNGQRLGEFFANDTQGKQLPGYLAALAECFVEEQKSTLEELEGLRKNIDHIKQIVSMQQSYAKVAGVVERLMPKQLIEDALHINAAALTRHGVRVEHEILDSRPILTEKHKVLQILVNLIRNAKYALSESNQKDKLMKLKASADGNGNLKIEVIDNGMGISAENLTRIFGHGFTTRPDGHGFGLHSCALTARDLGGSLDAQSDGLEKGATFTLVLPNEKPDQLEKAA